MDALGRDLRGGETDACSATPAGEAETPAQSGSGCRSGFCLWGGLSEDQLRCSRVQLPGGAALHCWGGHSTETASSEEVFLVVEARINLFYNGHHLQIASPMKTASKWTWQQTSTPEQTGQRGQGAGQRGVSHYRGCRVCNKVCRPGNKLCFHNPRFNWRRHNALVAGILFHEALESELLQTVLAFAADGDSLTAPLLHILSWCAAVTTDPLGHAALEGLLRLGTALRSAHTTPPWPESDK